MKVLRVSVFLGLSALFLGSTGCRKIWEDAKKNAAAEKAKREANEKKAAEAIPAFRGQLAKIDADVARLDAAALTDAACPDAAMIATIDATKHRGKLTLQTVTADALHELAKDGDAHASTSGKGGLEFLNSAVLGNMVLSEKGRPEDKRWRMGQLLEESGNYVGVFKVVGHDDPEVVEEEGTFTGENQYSGGEFEGWLLVYDHTTAKRVCQTHIVAKSSGRVKWREGRVVKTTFQEALLDDYKEQIQKATIASAKRVSTKLRFGYFVFE